MDCASFCITLSLCLQASDRRPTRAIYFTLLLQLIVTSTYTVHVRSCLLPRPLSFTPLPHSLPVTSDISPLTMATSLLIYPSPPHTLIPHLHLSPPPLPPQVWPLPGYVSLCSEFTLMSTATVAHSPLQPPPPPPPTPHSPHFVWLLEIDALGLFL